MTNQVAIVALAKALEKQMQPIQPGKYAVDERFIIHLAGTVLKSEDSSYQPTAEIPLKATLALLLEKAGVTGPHAQAMLVEAMQEAVLSHTDSASAIAARMKDVDAAMAQVQASLAKLPKKVRSGATRVDVAVEIESVPDWTASVA